MQQVRVCAGMIMFSSYNSLQNIVAKLYDDDGYTSMGRVTT
jgi:hypothetical protein